MSLIPQTPIQTDLSPVQDPFWPPVGTGEFRDRYRVDPGHSDDRCLAALQGAVFWTNALLRAWKSEQITAGFHRLSDLPADGDAYSGVGDYAPTPLVQEYQTAVYARAKAHLIAATRDIDTTGDGHRRADALEKTGSEYYREAHLAVRKITGQTALTVDLI